MADVTSTRVSKRRLAHAERVRVRVRGSCMTPALHDGESVSVRRQRCALPGDIVAFERDARGGGLALHRLLGVRPSRRGFVWVTQADNEPDPDPAFAPERLFGVAEVPVSLPERARSLARLVPALLLPLTRAARRAVHPVSTSAPR